VPEPGGSGTMLDNTTIVWTNELGKGNSHSHDDVPFVLLVVASVSRLGGRFSSTRYLTIGSG
jgi:hypothetical protein